MFSYISYSAATWDSERRVLVKEEHSRQGRSRRYILTNLSGNEQELYDKLYYSRADMENRIKEQQLCLFANCTSYL